MDTSMTMDGDRAGQERSDNGPGIVLCWCPAGSFRMGCEDVYDTWEQAFVPPDVVAAHGWPPAPGQEAEGEGGGVIEGDDLDDEEDWDEAEDDPTENWMLFDAETPVDVILSRGFWIGKYPVTQAEYEAVMGPGSHCSRFRDRDDAMRRPVENVAWDDAVMFCRELTGLERAAGRLAEGWAYRLPTEAQWEYASRAGTRARYSVGEGEEDLRRVAFIRDPESRYDPEAKRNQQTHAVGQKEPNAWGLHDNLGNVNEWCRDAYREVLPGGTDPFVPPEEEGEKRVVRGGHFRARAYECRVSSRNHWYPDSRFDTLGFRVALVRLVGGEPDDPRERTAESPLFTRRKATVEGRPIPEPPQTHDELQARAEAFLAKPDPSPKPAVFYRVFDELLRSYLSGAFDPEDHEARGFLVLGISGTVGDLKRLYGDAEDHMLERAALYRGMYQLFYDEDPDDYEPPEDEEEPGESGD